MFKKPRDAGFFYNNLHAITATVMLEYVLVNKGEINTTNQQEAAVCDLSFRSPVFSFKITLA